MLGKNEPRNAVSDALSVKDQSLGGQFFDKRLIEGVAKKNDLYFAREEKNFRLSHKFTLAALRLVTGFALG